MNTYNPESELYSNSFPLKNAGWFDMRVTRVDSTQYENLREFYEFCKIPRIYGEEWPSPLQSFREIYQIRKIPAIWFNIRVTQYVSFREFYQFRKIPWITGWELASPLKHFRGRDLLLNGLSILLTFDLNFWLHKGWAVLISVMKN